MDCPEVSRQLTALLYDELAPESRDRIDLHLEGCAECQAEWQSHRRTLTFLDRWPDAELPLDMSRLPRERPVRRRAVRTIALGLAAGVIGFLLMLWVGADLQLSQGELTLRLGRPVTPAVVEPVDDPWQPEFRELARRELRRQVELLASDLDETFESWNMDRQRRDAVLVRSIDDRREEDLDRVLSVFEDSLEEARKRESRLAAALQLLIERDMRRDD